MSRMRAFIGGIVAALAVAALVAYIAVRTGAIPAGADAALLPGERWASRTALNATLAREAPKPPYPYPPTDADITTGAKLYVQNCAVCHGTANTTPNALSRGMGVKPPQFEKRPVDDDPEGDTYWRIEHGIRFTAMPGFAKSLDERSIWQITYFLKRTPKDLTGEARAIWDDPSKVAPPTPMPALPERPRRGRPPS
jgi:thiosulfate dehydrogenase